ncbi:hypothetical protein c7_L27 [Megavirus courdo7]|uniref:Uncharacterized protein n=1 Tax=Megavirus courdo7 TaxID=1128135 RepID=H2E9M0_9VIRU|nr:hypothetical protein c7_L27 [Megavirus courdo7]
MQSAEDFEKMMQSLEKMTRKEIWDKLYERRYQYEKYYAPQPYKPFMLPNGLRIHEDIKDCIPNTVTHLTFGPLFNTEIQRYQRKPLRMQAEKKLAKNTVEEIIADLVNTETSCKKCQKPFIKGRCVVKKVGITCGHCGHHTKYGKLQESPKKIKHSKSIKH